MPTETAALVHRSARLDLDGVDFVAFERRPLDEDTLRCLRYMHDVEGHTACYLRDVLATRAHRDPEITAFLACWAYEEHWHGEAIARVLAAHGEIAGGPRLRALRRRLPRGDAFRPVLFAVGSALLGHLTAVHMTWGAVNEWTTQAGYARLAARARHPVLTDLLRRIMCQEGRHIDFYVTEARRRLGAGRAPQRLTRAALRRYWGPVGSGVMPPEEVDFVVTHLFGDDDGRAAARRIDAHVDRLPGLAGLRLVASAADRVGGRRAACAAGRLLPWHPVPPPDPFAPARLGPVELRNRILKAATFEGMSPRNVVSDDLVEFHRRMAGGGVAMTTVSYVAVSRDGMGAPAEIYVHDAAAEGLAHLADVVHAEGARVAAQLGHAGAVGVLPGKRVVGPSPGRTLLGTRVAAISPDGIDEVVGRFAAGARLLADAGYDAVELHFGHHYLVSAFLSPRWNRRTDAYGGGVENRARLAVRILRAVADALRRPDGTVPMAVTAKLNMTDAVRGGLGVDDAVAVARLLEAEGVLDALELTGGGSRANQMFMFRGAAPRREMAAVLPPPARAAFALVGPLVLRTYPFEELYFLPLARRFRAAVSLPLVLLGGVSSTDAVHTAMAEGFEFVAMGRALLREPDLVARMAAGTATRGTCIHCNKCMPSIYSGTRCVIDHPEPLRRSS